MIGSRKEALVDGQTISYLEHGDGTDVVLFLHGWGGSAESFQEMWEALEDRLGSRRFLAVDFPGFGESPPPSSAWSVGDYATCVVKYLELMGSSSVDLVSHSFGGRVTTVLLSDYPHLVKRNVYIAPAGIKHDDAKIKQIREGATVVKKIFSLPVLRIFFPLVRKYGYKLIGGTDYFEADGVMKETFQQVTDEDLSPRLSRIATPTQIYWGTNDTYVPVSDADYMKERIAGSAVTVFDDGRHGIHRTHASQIATQLSTFLA